MANMTLCSAKKCVADFLESQGLSVTLTAKRVNSISSTDLIRGSVIVVTIHNWRLGVLWCPLKALAEEHGFYVEAQ